MKKLLTLLAVSLLLFSTSTFAFDTDHVSTAVRGAFEKDFTKAKDVSWKKKSDIYFAWFTMNGFIMNAAYNEAGELVCTSRDIVVDQLPLSVSMTLAKKYATYTLPNKVVELNYEGETWYYITIANAKQTLKLKFLANGDVSVEEKIKNK